MKRNIFLIISLVLLIAATKTNGQVLITKNDSIPLGKDTIVNIVLPEARGNIQWQKSLDTKSWIDLESETNDTLLVKSNTEAMYRAVVTEGACLPVNSDTVGIVVLDTISANYLTPSSLGINLVSDSVDISNGTYIYTGVTDKTAFEMGKIIIDEHSATIRRITDIIQIGDTIITNTEQATLEDIFIDTSFKLSTSLMQPKSDLKSATLEEISKALTDDNGFIHPVSVTFFDGDGKKLKSASVLENQMGEENDLYFHIDINTELWDFNGEMILPDKFGNYVKVTGKSKCYFSDSYITLDPEFKFEFDFERPKISWDEMKISKGELNMFKFYSDESIFDVKMVLTKESDVSFTVGKKWSLLPQKLKVTMYYQVGPVPLWVDYEMDLNVKISASLGAGLNESKGFQNKTYITLGVGYENNDWHLIDDIYNNYIPISYGSGHGSTEVKLDLYPSIVWKFYSVAGPFFETGPYLKYESVKSLNKNWNKQIGLGFDASVGVLAGFMDYDFFSCSFNKNLYEETIWEAPAEIELISGNSQSAQVGKQLANPVKVRVLSSNDNPVAGAQVYFRPLQGKINNEIVLTDADGFASASWTMSDDARINRMEVFVKNGKDEEINEMKLDITATAIAAPVIYLPTVITTEATVVTETTATINGKVSSDGGANITERGFFWSKTNTNPGQNDKKETVSGTLGDFSKAISGLQSGSTYYYRAYATNLQGVGIGGVKTFRTKDISVIPDVKIENIITTSPICFAENSGQVNIEYTVLSELQLLKITISISGTNFEGVVIQNINDVENKVGTNKYQVTGLQAGEYSVRVEASNSNGKEYSTMNFALSQPAELNLNLSSVEQSPGATEGVINWIASGGVAPLQFKILQDGMVLINWKSNINGAIVEDGHLYTVQVRDSNGCFLSKDIYVADY